MKKINRRQFICYSTALLASAAPLRTVRLPWITEVRASEMSDIRGKIFRGDAPEKIWKWSHEGAFYEKLSGLRVACGICPNRCILSPGDRSVCRSKINVEGVLYSIAYGNPCSVHIDPIEKKPLYHFKPRSTAFSLATTGCNFRCLNCQNWEISQAKPEQARNYELFPKQVVEKALASGSESIAYTYSEPTTFYEYMMDTARLAKEKGLHNLWISNGYINHKPLLEFCRVMDGANVNLKSFSDSIYRKLNGGRLQPVLNTFKTLHEQGVHFEMTNLVVPGYTDDEEMVKKMCGWILENIGQDHPLHFSRFFPKYKLDRLAPTPVSVLTRFRKLAIQAGIRYVYVGNVMQHEGNHTYCHHCGKLIIQRTGYYMPEYHLEGSRCGFCGTIIPGVWS